MASRAAHVESVATVDEHGARVQAMFSDIAHGYDRGTGRSRASWRRTRQFNLFLKDESESRHSTAEIRERVRELLPVKAGVNLRIAARSCG